VCVQHLLETTGSLIQKFIEFGFLPSNIHVLGKLYSTNPGVQRQLRALGINVYESGDDFAWGEYSNQISMDISLMWEQAARAGAFDQVRKIIVLDDGGGCIAAVPPVLAGAIPIVGVEQTMSGITLNRSERPLIPFVGVGSSASKVLIEPRIIQNALFRRATQKTPFGTTAGVVGNGYIGHAVCEGLRAAGIQVFTYDKDVYKQSPEEDGACETLEELYKCSDIIWGCTGADHLCEHNLLEYLATEKTLISCSSKDSEFRSALNLINEQPEEKYLNRLSDVVLKTPASSVKILRGGFPINFDGSPESAPAEDIQLTRALLFAGVLQAVSCDDCVGSDLDIDLDPSIQMKIVSRWFELHPQRRSWYSMPTHDVFKSADSVRRNGSRFYTPPANEFSSLHL
jgi:S-adenosylhomocysteine hydrolase